jgi:thymidylate kinase
VVARALKSQADVVIFDRYIYDQLANVAGNLAGQFYIRLLLALVPHPDIAYVLDADPEVALARKPEYPLDFLQAYRRAYFRLSEMAREIVVVPPAALDNVERVISSEFRKRWPHPLPEDHPENLRNSELTA